MIEPTLLYLSEADVAGLGMDLDALREAVAAAFAAKARGAADAAPKSVVNVAPGHVFQAKPAILREDGYAGMKWFGLVPPGATAGPSISSTIILSDIASGMAVALIAGDWITAKRTAAMSAIAARALARPDSASIGFVGAGVQGHSHLEALPRVLPGLRRAVVCSRTAASADALAAAARAMGLEARVVSEPRDAVAGLDVIVTTVPEGAARVEFLDPDWVAPGAFVAAVDLARSWRRSGLRSFEILATDDHEQTRALTAAGRMTFAGPYEADLADLCAGRFAGRASAAQRAMFNFSGHALADLAAARIAYATARRVGLGTRLAR
ncbi:MAG: ornithine cyclodeaminase family protein [Burkholderiales bacterium]|nr:ornithine cyclodeaminase family protein [Burkholderiales bacterium]